MSRFQIIVLGLLGVIACVVFAGVGVVAFTMLGSTGGEPEEAPPVANDTPDEPPPPPTSAPTATSTSLLPTAASLLPTPTNTPVVLPTGTPTSLPENPRPATPELAAIQQPESESIAPVPQTESEFRTYLTNKYSVFAGKQLNIEDIDINDELEDFSFVSINLTDDSFDFFRDQSREDAMVYATNLFNDVKAYYKDKDFIATVSRNFYTTVNPRSYCDYDDEWCYADYDYSDQDWYVSMDVVQVSAREDYESIDVRNYR